MSLDMSTDAYQRAQLAVAELKASIREVIANGPSQGMTNAEVGRTLGIYEGHEGHEGHIPRTLLSMMEREGIVEQDEETRRWRLREHVS